MGKSGKQHKPTFFLSRLSYDSTTQKSNIEVEYNFGKNQIDFQYKITADEINDSGIESTAKNFIEEGHLSESDSEIWKQCFKEFLRGIRSVQPKRPKKPKTDDKIATSISKKPSVDASQEQAQNRSNITSPTNPRNNLLTLNIDQNGSFGVGTCSQTNSTCFNPSEPDNKILLEFLRLHEVQKQKRIEVNTALDQQFRNEYRKVADYHQTLPPSIPDGIYPSELQASASSTAILGLQHVQQNIQPLVVAGGDPTIAHRPSIVQIPQEVKQQHEIAYTSDGVPHIVPANKPVVPPVVAGQAVGQLYQAQVKPVVTSRVTKKSTSEL